LAAVYNRYRVLRIEAHLNVINSGIEFPAIVVLSADNTSGAFSTITQALTSPFSDYTVLGNNPMTSAYK